MRFYQFLPLLGLLAGCLSVTPGGLIEASRFDPLGTDPADIGAAVGIPETTRLSNGDAVIVMTYTLKGELQPRVNERFSLEIDTDPGGSSAPERLPEEALYFARLSERDVLRMRDAQARIRTLKAQGREGSGSFSVGVSGGCSTTFPVEKLPVRTFLKLRSGGFYVQTTTRRDLFRVLPQDESDQLRAAIAACD